MSSRKIRIVTGGPQSTENVGEHLAGLLSGGECVLLKGELGTGKTCFVRGLARGFGVDPRRVKSPSYDVLRRYSGTDVTLNHFDAYFIREEEEFDRNGLLEFLSEGEVVAVEWADRFEEHFGGRCLWIEFLHRGEASRELIFSTACEEMEGVLDSVESFHETTRSGKGENDD